MVNNYLFQAMYYALYFHPFCMCGSATLAQVLQDNSKEFVDKMHEPWSYCTNFVYAGPNSWKVKRAIMQSMSREKANAILNDHLKMEVEKVQTLRKIFEVASDKSGYGKMNTFAKGMLEKLASVQWGMDWCEHCTMHSIDKLRILFNSWSRSCTPYEIL